MPSLTARIFGFVFRTTGIFKKNFAGGPSMDAIIKAARSMPTEEPSAKMRAKLNITRDEFEGRTVWHITPIGHSSPKRLIYWHGGGYVYSAAKPHWDFLGTMALKHGIAIIVPLYPLAPEADAVATTDFALSFYTHLLTQHDPSNLAMGGDSAGGGLTAATLMAARARG
jgi:epsilon-lactone hydrolase